MDTHIPSTAMASRPTTARPLTHARPGTAVANESSCVVAVLEGRGVAREVGIAALEKDTGRVTLVQVNFQVVVSFPSLN